MYLEKVRKQFFSVEMKLAGAAVIILLAACIINTRTDKPILNLSKQDTALNINKDLLVFLSAGNKRLITDLLWVQTLIESDVEHYNKRDLNNWLFLRFNTIASLDKLFYENYLYGGLFLGIMKDDLEGADALYSKGIRYFPDDYQLNYNAGFLNYYELGNAKKGLAYLEKIQNHSKAPPFISSIVNKLKVEAGATLDEIFILVQHHLNSTPDETLKRKLRQDLYAIKAEIDLKCLNHGGTTCNLRDVEGNSYVNTGGKFHSVKKFLPYRIYKRGEKNSPLKKTETNTF
ncbi:MAG TPA: hypothetical protein VNJ01_12805 [Bacteriovoracaceae bacterium]|nr:hypothetical protein [Bacteriovoracaceae bacterium]